VTSVAEVDGEQVRSPSTSTTRRQAQHDPPPRWVGPSLAALVVVSAAATAVSARSGAFYYDDYWNLEVVRSLPQGWSLLGRPVFGHVTPGANALMRLVAGPGAGSYGWAVAQLVVFAALLPVGAYAAARALGARRPPALAAAIVVVVGAGWASASMWWSAGLNLYPSALSGMAVIVATRAMAAGCRWAAAAAAVALAFGLCFSEGAVVFLVFAVVIAAADAGGSGRDRVTQLWRDRRSWAVVCSPIIGLAIVRASAPAPLETSAHPPVVDAVIFPFVLLVKGFLPLTFGLFPGKVDVVGSTLLTVVAAFAVCVVFVAMLADSKRFRWMVVALVATVLARGAMVAWSRLVVLGWDAAVEMRYLADLAWLVPVVVAANVPPPGRATAQARGVVLGAFALVLVGSVAGQTWLVRHAPAVEARAYRDRLGAAIGGLDDQTAVLDVPVPASVLGPQFGGYTFLSRTVANTGLELPLGPSPRFAAPDDQGRLHAVQLHPVSTLLPEQAFTATGAPGVEHRNGCWVAGAEAALVWTPLSKPVGLGAWVIDLHHGRRSSPEVELESAGVAPQQGIATGAATKGNGVRWVLSSLPFSATQIGFRIPPHQRLCLERGTVDDVERRS
jgi:hypothetical protein